METRFFKGFTIYKHKPENGIVIATPHSGPALEINTSRDDNSETVASLLFKKLGGTLIIANISRKRLWGIDFNRDIPPLQIALENYKNFEEDKEEAFEYRKRYAFVAQNEEDYYNRLIIYQNFWGEISKGKYIFLIHRAFPRVKALPSIMDVITFKEKGIKKKIIDKVVSQINSKYSKFLEQVEHSYKKMIFFEEERLIANIVNTSGSFNLKKMNKMQRSNVILNMKKIRKYAKHYVIDRLEHKFNIPNYLNAVANTLENSPMPHITIENVFDGSLAFGPKRKLFLTNDKIVLEVEPSRFLNFWYPEVTASIISDIFNKIKKN